MKLIISISVACFLGLSFAQSQTTGVPSAAKADAAAQAIFNAYKNNTTPYGASMDCTIFTRGALAKSFTITQIMKETINNEELEKITNPSANYADKITGKDPISKGVVQALVDAGLGKEITVTRATDLRPGDFVQYWYPAPGTSTSPITYAGHSAMVVSVVGNVANLFGAHRSKNGIGTIGLGDNLIASKTSFFAVRPYYP